MPEILQILKTVNSLAESVAAEYVSSQKRYFFNIFVFFQR